VHVSPVAALDHRVRLCIQFDVPELVGLLLEKGVSMTTFFLTALRLGAKLRGMQG